MAGRQKFSQQQVIDALTESKGLITYAAERLHCVPNTVDNYCDRYPRVRAARDAGRRRQLDVAEAKLFEAIGTGEGWAITFLLRTIGRGRGYADRLEVDATLDVLNHPAWLQTRAALLQALGPHPEARLAVVGALRALASPPAGAGEEDAG